MKCFISILIIMVAIVLAGCSATPLTQGQIDLQKSAYESAKVCFERLKQQDVQVSKLLQKVPQDQVALVMVLQSVQENNKALMAIATGNQYNPCSTGQSAFDVQIAEIIHKNKAASSATSDVMSLGKWVVGGLTLTSMFDKVAGDTIISGDNNKVDNTSVNSTDQNAGDTINNHDNTNDQDTNITDNTDNSDNSVE